MQLFQNIQLTFRDIVNQYSKIQATQLFLNLMGRIYKPIQIKMNE